MAAHQGNQFWKARSKHGKDKLFSTPEILWDAACEYFQWVEENPLWESKLFNNQGEIVEGVMHKIRAMTLEGLWLFLDISDQCWYDYKAREDYVGVTKKIEWVIRSQKFSGAAAGLLNANIIARDLGLRDSSEVQHSGSVSLDKASDDELNARIQELLNATGQS